MSRGLLAPETVGTVEPVAVIEAEAPSSASATRAPGRGLWLKVGLAVALLSASAAGRAWQSSRVDQVLRAGRKPPFALKDLPMQMGPWMGRDEFVDEQVIRTTGSTDSIFRSYQNQVTGQRVSLLVLFGPCTEMYGHTPEVCYPATGYTQVKDAIPRVVESGGSSWPFRELVYAKGEGGQAEVQDVFYTWRYSGKWTPKPSTYQEFERMPSMFKVQAARRIVNAKELDLLDVGNPCEASLALLMAEIDRRIAEAEAAGEPEA